jgi:glyoxalase family protein
VQLLFQERKMKLEGLHHITMITGDAQRNVDFYADVLGLRLVKKTINFDQPEAYHLYFGDETGAPGSILTWFEFAGAQRGRPGVGMIHTITLGVPSPAALDFWAARLVEQGHAVARTDRGLSFADPDGLALELVVADDGNPPLAAVHPDVPAEHAITGAEGARAYSSFAPVEEKVLTDTLGFDYLGDGEYRLQGARRHFRWAYDQAPPAVGVPGAGTVHHIAWASQDDDHLRWQARVGEAGGYVTDVRDRDYFNAIYFREPRGVLFEIATMSPGFAADEDPDRLGEGLRVPRQHEHLRDQLEGILTPLVNPRTARREQGTGTTHEAAATPSDTPRVVG